MDANTNTHIKRSNLTDEDLLFLAALKNPVYREQIVKLLKGSEKRQDDESTY